MDARLLLWAALLAGAAARGAQNSRSSQALKCRTEDDDQNEFREVARHCMGNVSNWERPSDDRGGWRRPGRGGNTNGGGGGGNAGGSGGGHQDSRYGGYGYGNRDNTGHDTQRNRNNGNNSNRNNQQSNYWPQNMHDNNRNDKNNNRDSQSSESSIENSDLEHFEPCIIHCIFRQMQMLDEDSYPDRTGVTNVMMRNVQDSRVKDFVEQAVDECFEIIDTDNRSNKCESAKNLAICLEDKGRQNCEDWDDPPEPNKQRGSNKNNKSRNQQRDSTGLV